MSTKSESAPSSDRCFACFSISDETLSILHGETEFSIVSLFEKHFWFHPDDFRENQFLCPSCWNQLESFHRFYLVVEQNHRIKSERKPSPDRIDEGQLLPPVEVKLEELDVSSEPDDSSDDEFKPDDDQSEEAETKVEEPRKKRKYTKRKKPGDPPAPPKKRGKYKIKNAEELAQEDEFIKTHVKYNCEFCMEDCFTFTAYQRHVLDEHDSDKAYITCCGKKYYKKKALLEHVQRLTNPDMFQCDICKKSFVNSYGRQKHMEDVHVPDELKNFACNRCPKRFMKESQLAYHLKGHENLDKGVAKCHICDKSYATEALLKTHIKSSHERPTDFICDICAKGFFSKTEFARHKLTHELTPAELRRQCDICQKWLKSEANWKKHLIRHRHGPVKCNQCDHESPSKHSLAAHKRNRHGAPNPALTCQECGKQFKRILNLREHMVSHTGEGALYSCCFCSRTFNSRANMFSHRKKMHPQEWLELRTAQQASQFT
ncbi:hypothetical protein quinque_014223 [Culex quinquefasciatus]